MINKIAADIYQLPVFPGNSINVYLIENILIDAGINNSGNKIVKAIGEREVKAHAITHAHADHQGAGNYLCNHCQIPFWFSHGEKENAETGNTTAGYLYQNNLITKLKKIGSR